jgi:xylulokinase
VRGGEVVLGIDIGTSTSRGVIAWPDGRTIATAERAHTVSSPRPGWVEHDAEAVWWADFTSLCGELLAQAPGPIAAVCASGAGPCMLVADEAGRPLRPAILYGVDTRATQEIAELSDRYGAEHILQRCGSPLSTQAVGPKLAWIRRHEPDVWRRTRKLFLINSFLVYRLTGEYALDSHLASQCTPLYDIHQNRWIEEWAEQIAPGLPLPPLRWPVEIAGVVTPQAATVTGIAAGTPVAMGSNDARTDALSVGVCDPGDMMLTYGTTMYLMNTLPEIRTHPRLWCAVGIEPGIFNLGGGMATAGALTDWLRHLVGDVPYEQLAQEAAALAPGSDGLIALPYFAGERSPIFDPKARGVICGLTLRHGRAHLYRALIEATAYGVRHILDTMREIDGQGTRLVAVGGGARGGLWPQIVSDVTGRVQELPSVILGACYGSALLAARAVGLVEPTARWNAIAGYVEPIRRAHEIYDTLYPLYRDLYPATLPQMHALADLQISDSARDSTPAR